MFLFFMSNSVGKFIYCRIGEFAGLNKPINTRPKAEIKVKLLVFSGKLRLLRFIFSFTPKIIPINTNINPSGV